MVWTHNGGCNIAYLSRYIARESRSSLGKTTHRFLQWDVQTKYLQLFKKRHSCDLDPVERSSKNVNEYMDIHDKYTYIRQRKWK